MTRRVVLCEGPDDLAALREIALYVFGVQKQQQAAAAGAAGDDRRATLRAGRVLVEIKASHGGKSALPRLAATELSILPIQHGSPADERMKRLAVIFDPDEHPEATFHSEVTVKIAEVAPAWTLREVAPGSWLARREPGERVQVRAIAWRGPDGVVDGLADHQNLDRLLCAVAARAFPAEAPLVERWLGEIGTTRGKPPGWKAALHLWCALVEEKTTERNASTRFLHQNKACRPVVEAVLRQVSLFNALRPIFSAPS